MGFTKYYSIDEGVISHMHNINQAIGQRIAYYRKQQGLTQKELAALAGIKSGYLSVIETGGKAVRIPRLARIAWALSVSLGELLGAWGGRGLR